MENDTKGSQLFREKSLQRISSPEDLHDYVRVANPGVWMILAAVIILLIGFCVWGIFGHLTSTVSAVCVTSSGETVCYISESDVSRVSEGMTVKAGDGEYTVQSISSESLDATAVLSEYAMHVSGLTSGEWVRALTLSADASDGIEAAQVIIDDIHPISFILN